MEEKCTVCGKTFQTAAGCRAHMKMKHGIRATSFLCTFPGCTTTTTFSSLNALNKHMKPNHRLITCTYKECNKAFVKQNDMENHVDMKHKKIYPCPQSRRKKASLPCPTRTASTGKALQSFSCDKYKCKKTFKSLGSLKQHINNKHGEHSQSEPIPFSENLADPHLSSSPGNISRHFACDKCKRTFKSLHSLQQHTKAKHGAAHNQSKTTPSSENKTDPQQHSVNKLDGRPLAKHTSVIPATSFLMQTCSYDLNTYIAQDLQPDEEFHDMCGKALDQLVQYLQQNVQISVAKVIKGGSYGKGTAIKGNSDIDTVIFINDFNRMEDMRDRMSQILDRIESTLQHWKRENPGKLKIEEKTPYSLKLILQPDPKRTESVEIDLDPAFDILSDREFVYRVRARDQDDDTRRLYSICLTELVTNFVKEKPAAVKSLIRLVKHWKNTTLQVPRDNKELKVLKSYLLELVTIGAWEKAGRPSRFNMRKGLAQVLRDLVNYRHLDVHWDANYKYMEYWQSYWQHHPSRPFVLDPADPYDNVCSQYNAATWLWVAATARASLQCPLLATISPAKILWVDNANPNLYISYMDSY